MPDFAISPLKLRALRGAFKVLRTVSPTLALRWAKHMFSTPQRHKESDAERNILQTGCAFHFRANGLRLRAHAWGEGPAVVLLHGWEGRGAQFHTFIKPLVDAGYAAITFDQPAHGRSQGKRTGPVGFAQALQSLVQEIGPIHGIVAHSLGAASAAIAMDQGLPVSRLVFIAPPAEPDPYFGGLLSMLGFPEEEHLPAFEAFAARTGLPWDRVRLRSLAPSMRSPLLVIHDREDREVPLTGAEAIASAWPGARLLTTEGLGHRRILRDAEVARATVAFLNEGQGSTSLPFYGCGPRTLEWPLFRRDLRTA